MVSLESWLYWRIILSGIVLLHEIVDPLRVVYTARLYANGPFMWSPQHLRVYACMLHPHVPTVHCATVLDMDVLMVSALARSSYLTRIKNAGNRLVLHLTFVKCFECDSINDMSISLKYRIEI
jgi:hypothetical protein